MRAVYPLLVAVLLSGCDRVLNIRTVEGLPLDAAGTDAGMKDAAPPCLADDFSGAVVDASTWLATVEQVTNVTQANGELILTLGASSNPAYASVETQNLDLTHDSVAVEVIERPAQVAGTEMGLSLDDDSLPLPARYRYFARHAKDNGRSGT